MRILHAKDEATGAPIENAFVAMEGYDTVLGECQVEARSYPALLPERPHIVDIVAKGQLRGAGRAVWRGHGVGPAFIAPLSPE